MCKAYQLWPHQVPHQVHPNCNAGSTASTQCAAMPLLQVWSVPSQRFQFTLSGHSNWVRACQFSPDGRLAVSGGDDKTVRVWDIPTRQCIRIYDDHSGHVNTVAFHPDGTCIASGGTDDAIKVNTEHELLGRDQLLPSSLEGHVGMGCSAHPGSAQGAGHRGRALPQGSQTAPPAPTQPAAARAAAGSILDVAWGPYLTLSMCNVMSAPRHWSSAQIWSCAYTLAPARVVSCHAASIGCCCT